LEAAPAGGDFTEAAFHRWSAKYQKARALSFHASTGGAAGLAVSQAERIMFLGYRFPVTDAFARVYFLRAIKKAIDAGTLKTIEIVLWTERARPGRRANEEPLGLRV
jgi:hypothetical protein